MTDQPVTSLNKWSAQDLEQLFTKLKTEELDFADQCRIVQFLQDLYEDNTKLLDAYRQLYQIVVSIEPSMVALASLGRQYADGEITEYAAAEGVKFYGAELDAIAAGGGSAEPST